MDEKVLEEVRFHQDAVSKDASSPLFQIREKEMEISGRVFAARNQADKMLSDARQRATDIVSHAHESAADLAKERADAVMAASEDEIKQIGKDGARDVAALKKELAKRQGAAADFVAKTVTSL